MTGTELIQAVRDLLGEDTPAAFSDALILRQINHAYRELYSEIVENNENYFATTATINWVASTEAYTLPTTSKLLYIEITTATGIYKDTKVTFIDLSKRWEYVEPSGIDVNAEVDRKVYLLGNTVGVLPVPTSAVTAAMRVYHVPPLTALVAGTSPPLEWSTDHHEVIAWGALRRLLVRDKEAMAEISPTFNRLKLLLLNATSARETQEPQMIVDTYGV